VKRLIASASCFLAMSLTADVPPAQQAEVQHLLNYLGSSHCGMIRNGKAHDAAEAVQHVRRKYDHYRDRIDSTEDFIAYAATKSLVSGRAYQVQCPGEAAVTSADFLSGELARYRADSR
jgi:hypothetical protein